MISISPNAIAERFMRYAAIDTQSDPDSATFPSTEKQKDLARLLADELRGFGLDEVELDPFGYVYATLPANTQKENIPPVCFCAHMDTAPDCSGTNVKPIYHKNYAGGEIVLPDDPSQVLRPAEFPYLNEHIGHGIITASGTTLLGADDKSGIAAIMEAVHFLIQRPDIKHGAIKILFTPDEEVGRGTAKIDMEKISASIGYTLDGGVAGSLEDETFNADGALVTYHGVSIHPGYAKGKMVNAMKIAGALLNALPMNEWCPEGTEKRQGFVHPVAVNVIEEKASIRFIVRDFDVALLEQHHARLRSLAESVLARFPGAHMTYEVTEQYRNMKLELDKFPAIMAHAAEAITRAGLTVKQRGIRGGTDGSRLSYMGMPCPNIFTGMQNIHSKLEWIGSRDMAKAAETIIHLAMIWEEKGAEAA